MQRHPEPLLAWHSLSSSRTANCQILLRAICFIMPFSAAFRSTFATSNANGQPNSRSQREQPVSDGYPEVKTDLASKCVLTASGQTKDQKFKWSCFDQPTS